MNDSQIVCNNCGKKNQSGNKFCSECGFPIINLNKMEIKNLEDLKKAFGKIRQGSQYGNPKMKKIIFDNNRKLQIDHNKTIRHNQQRYRSITYLFLFSIFCTLSFIIIIIILG